MEERNADSEDFIDILNTDFQAEHAFLLCTDGLSDLVTSARLLELILANSESPRTLVGVLLDEANAAGGKDNITAIFVMGSKFCQAVDQMRRDSAATYKDRVISILLNRWSILFYGLIVGGLVVFVIRP